MPLIVTFITPDPTKSFNDPTGYLGNTIRVSVAQTHLTGTTFVWFKFLDVATEDVVINTLRYPGTRVGSTNEFEFNQVNMVPLQSAQTYVIVATARLVDSNNQIVTSGGNIHIVRKA